MGKFDDEIDWCRQRRAFAVQDIRELESGRRQWAGPKGENGITQELLKKARQDVVLFDRLIAAYEKHNA
jgi:hypothetical protein